MLLIMNNQKKGRIPVLSNPLPVPEIPEGPLGNSKEYDPCQQAARKTYDPGQTKGEPGNRDEGKGDGRDNRIDEKGDHQDDKNCRSY